MIINTEEIANSLGKTLGIPLKIALCCNDTELSLLNQKEIALLTVIKHKKRQESWLKGRLALKALLASMGQEGDTTKIQFPNKYLSLTHSSRYALAVGTSANHIMGIGVDLQFNTNVNIRGSKFFLTLQEQAWLNSVANSEKTKHFIRLWTVKESLYKAYMLNQTTMLTDYCLRSPGATAGSAYLKNPPAEMRYVSIDLGTAFLSAAICAEITEGAGSK